MSETQQLCTDQPSIWLQRSCTTFLKLRAQDGWSLGACSTHGKWQCCQLKMDEPLPVLCWDAGTMNNQLECPANTLRSAPPYTEVCKSLQCRCPSLPQAKLSYNFQEYWVFWVNRTLSCCLHLRSFTLKLVWNDISFISTHLQYIVMMSS